VPDTLTPFSGYQRYYCMNMNKWVAILLLSTVPAVLYAQVSADVNIGIGTYYASAKNSQSKYLPTTKPNASTILNIPIKNRVALRTGLMYSIRGYNTVNKEDFGKNKLYYTSNYRMHYISVPLMASFRVMDRKTVSLWMDGGMSYNFFLHGYMRYDYKNYKGNELVSEVGEKYRINGKIAPSKYGSTQNSYDVTGLDVAMKMQLRVVIKEKYSLSVFHENSLYDIRVKPDNPSSSVKMRNTGMSIGYIIR